MTTAIVPTTNAPNKNISGIKLNNLRMIANITPRNADVANAVFVPYFNATENVMKYMPSNSIIPNTLLLMVFTA
jgi:hypothetical protein